MSVAVTIVILGLQFASFLATQKYNKRNADRIRELREQAQRDSLAREHELAEKKFQENCKRIREIELEAHKDNLRDIENGFQKTFLKNAHNEALQSYPLMISPYIIKNCILPFGIDFSVDSRPPIPFCILSTSNNRIFNEVFFPFLDDAVQDYVARYWNTLSAHCACYYKGAWNPQIPFDDIHPTNLKALMPEAPIILFTPYLVPEGARYRLFFKIKLWGREEALFEPKGIPTFDLGPTSSIKIEEVQTIVDSICPYLICLFGFYVDAYYWINCFMKPILPSLLNDGLFPEEVSLRQAITDAYIELLHNSFSIPHSNEVDSNCPIQISDIVSLNTYVSPDKAIGLLKATAELTKESRTSEIIIWETLSYIYNIRCGGTIINSYEDVDVHQLSEIDLVAIRKAIEVAQEHCLAEPLKGLTNIIRREIVSKPM